MATHRVTVRERPVPPVEPELEDFWAEALAAWILEALGNYSALRVPWFSWPAVILGAIWHYTAAFIPGVETAQTIAIGLTATTPQETERQRNHAMRNQVIPIIAHYEIIWPTLTVAQRQRTLVRLLEVAENILGIPPINIAFLNYSNANSFLLHPDAIGGFINGTRTILINLAHISDEYVLHAIFHEARHAYQFEARLNPSRYMISRETHRFWGPSYIVDVTPRYNYMASPVEWDARHFTGDSHVYHYVWCDSALDWTRPSVVVVPIYYRNWYGRLPS